MGIETAHRKGKRKGKEFMDAALDAYIRYETLRNWRSLERHRHEHSEQKPEDAVRDVGHFPERGDYAPLWEEHWRRHVIPVADGERGSRFAAMEAAIRDSVIDERELREEREQDPLEDLSDYNAFIRQALGRLFQEASGEIEEI